MNWKYSAIFFGLVSVSLFVYGADFDGESPVPSDREDVAPYEDEILEQKGRLTKGVVSVAGIGGKGFGTGFVVHEDGYIFTNSHVVAGCITPGTERVRVSTASNNHYTARVMAVADRERVDFAVLKVDKPMPDVEPLELGDASDLERNETVFSIGHPGRLGAYVVSAGRVQKVTEENVVSGMPNSQGASGSPIFNMDGEVVSILYGGSVSGANEPQGKPVVWHGNKQKYRADTVTDGARMKEAEKFFREEFSDSLADEIFGSGGGK